jgi:hypothetical protein
MVINPIVMKHFILTLLVFICAVVTVNRCEAQGPSSYISPTDSNYFQITKQYDRYFKDQDSLIRTGVITLSHADSLLEEDGMRMKYERWKNFWGFRVDEHGSFKTAQTETNYVLDNWNPCRTNTTQDDQISWSNIGPFNSEGARLADDNQGRVDAIDVNPADTNDIIVGAYNGGIWRSRDGGKTWVNTTDDEGYSIYGITSIARHPAYPDVLYATTGTNLDFWGLSTRGYGMGLIYSNDGGNSWYKTDYHADPSTGTDHAHKVVVDPRSGSIISGLVRFPTILYVCNDVTVRTYTGNIDGLGSWTDIPGLPSWGYTWNCAYLGADKFNDMEIKPDGTLWFCNIKGVYTYRAGDATYTTISYPIPPAATVSNTCTGIIYGATTNPEAQFINIEIDRWNNVWLYIDYLVADGISTSHNLGYYYKLQGSDWYISDVVTARNLPHPFKPSINNENVLYQEDVTSYPRLVNKLNFTLSTPYHLSIVSNTMISNAHTDVRAIYLHKNSSMALGIDQIYVGEDGGICKTKDANLWYSISGTGAQGLCNTNYYGLGSWEKDSKFICAGAQDGNINLFVKGKMYETEPDGDNGDCAFVKDNTGVVFQESSGGGGGSPVVCPSTYNSSMHDMNVSSYILPSGAVDKDYIAVPMETGKTHVNDLVVGYQKVFCSHDNGGTWQEVYDATKYNSDHLSIASMALGSSDGAAYIIYFSTYGGDPSLLDRKEQNAIYKATSNTGAAGSWTIIDITDNLRLTDRTDPSHTYLPAPISDISIDPFNPDKIWICFAGFIPEYKVWKRDLSLTGSTWHTVVPPTGSCFPNIPCKSIVYQPINYPYTTTDPYHLDINPERLYVGTDMGVFYFDNSMSDWDYFGIGGPRTMVTDMEINQCGQQLIVSTAGRGLWTADLVPNREYQVLHDEVYVSNFWNDIFDRDIHIFNGATFTINSGTTLNMGRNRKIIVDIGAKLLVNGGIITNDCNAMWEGIIVRGSKTDPQDISSTDGLVAHSYNQGFVFLKDATISNAHEAIRVWNPDDVWVSQNRTDNQGQTGGIVRAEKKKC